MKNEKWEKTISKDKLKEGVPVSTKVGKRTVLLVKRGDKICAMGGKCSHYGAPLEEGLLLEHVLTCPWHTARFDVRTGKMKSPPALDDLPRYETKVEAGDIYVRKARPEALAIPRGKDDRTFLILGTGAGGVNAALSLRKTGFAGRVLMVTAEADLPYDRPDLSKGYMAGDTVRDGLTLKPEPFYDELGIEILKKYRATGVDTGGKTVTFSNGRRLRYDRLLLATGGAPRLPEVKGNQLPGFFVLRSLADAEAITSALSKAKTVALIGASFIGLEVAASLRSRNLDVHVIAPETVLMARVFGERIGDFIKRTHEKNGAVFHLGKTVAEITGGKRIMGLILSDGSRIAAEVVIAGVGVVPATGYLQKSGLLVNGAVPVNTRLQTKDPDVFAVGDIALVPDPVTGEPRRVEHWVEAERQGQHAALTMAGVAKDYRETPFFWTTQHGISIKYAGFASSFDHVEYRGDLEAEDVLAGFYREGALRAVASIGRTMEFLVAGEILKARASVPPSRFKDPRVDLADWIKPRSRLD